MWDKQLLSFLTDDEVPAALKRKIKSELTAQRARKYREGATRKVNPRERTYQGPIGQRTKAAGAV